MHKQKNNQKAPREGCQHRVESVINQIPPGEFTGSCLQGRSRTFDPNYSLNGSRWEAFCALFFPTGLFTVCAGVSPGSSLVLWVDKAECGPRGPQTAHDKCPPLSPPVVTSCANSQHQSCFGGAVKGEHGTSQKYRKWFFFKSQIPA